MHLPQGYINVLEGHKPPQERVYDYVYQYKDHLGNIRLSFAYDRDRQEIRTLTEYNYYPFGLEHSYLQTRRRPELVDEIVGEININSEPSGHSRMVQVDDVRYQYKYNGKEWQDELGLNMYAMDMRQYDPAIARWVVQDPIVHHSFSPYSAFDNNPVFWADPSGADSEKYTEEDHNNWVRKIEAQWAAVDARYSARSVFGAMSGVIDKLAVKSLIKAAKLFINGEDLSNLTERKKQHIFETDAMGTIGILLWEFATGTGKSVREFEVGTHPFANILMEGRIFEEIIKEFSELAKNDGYDFSKNSNSREYIIALEFSPNINPKSWVESLYKHVNSNPSQLFVGGAVATVSIQNNNLMIQIYNETSRNSLMLHVAENYNRNSKDANKPLSTIKKYINAKFELIRN